MCLVDDPIENDYYISSELHETKGEETGLSYMTTCMYTGLVMSDNTRFGRKKALAYHPDMDVI